jgi:hypothetical protein
LPAAVAGLLPALRQARSTSGERATIRSLYAASRIHAGVRTVGLLPEFADFLQMSYTQSPRSMQHSADHRYSEPGGCSTADAPAPLAV